MSEQLDILGVDIKIRKNFKEQFDKLELYQSRLKGINDSLLVPNLKHRIRNTLQKASQDLIEYVDNLEKQTEYNFYIIKTVPLIEEYKKILQKPIKITFMGKPQKNNKEKNKLVQQFLEIASHYVDIDVCNLEKDDDISCPNCSNKKEFDIIDRNIYICLRCYAQQSIMKHISSYNDIDRINISSKYMYDRKVHFRDCIKQYQGKQNSTIPIKIYENLEEEFRSHHLLKGDKNSPNEIKFINITKNHILLFLKDLGYSGHYENVHLIHYMLTKIKPDDITYLEDQLLDDFDSLTDLYDKEFKDINRKNFINTQYVLYQLLCRHKHKCNKEEFIILKTIDRKFFHDEVCKNLFEQLGWNHTPFY